MDQNHSNSLTPVNAVKTETRSVSNLGFKYSAHESGSTAELAMQTPPSQSVVDRGVANPDADVRPIPPRPTATKTVSHLPGKTTTAEKSITIQEANAHSSSLHSSGVVAKEKAMLPPPPVQKASEKKSPSLERMMPPPPRLPESSQPITNKVLLPLPRQKPQSVDSSAAAQDLNTGHMPPPPPTFDSTPISRQTEPPVPPPVTPGAQPVRSLASQSIRGLRPLPSPRPDPWTAFGWQRVPSKSKANSFSYLHVKTGLRQKK